MGSRINEEFGKLSENVMIKLTITEFSNMFESRIFESESDGDASRKIIRHV